MLLVVAAAGAGCARDGGGTAASAPSTSAPSTATPSAGGAGGRWAGLLSAVPAEGELADDLVLNDLAAARGLVASSAPALDDRTGWARYVDGLSRGKAGVIGNEWDGVLCTRCQRGTDSIGAWWQRVFGYTVADVDLEVSGGAPPRQYALLQGRFEPARIEAAFKATPEGGSGYRAEPRDGGVLLTSDCEDLNRCHPPTDRDAIGRDLRAFVSQDLVVVSPSTATIDALLATRGGGAARLVDEPSVASVVDAVDREGLYTAAVYARPPAADPLRPDVGIGPYAAAAAGLHGGDGNQTLVLIFSHVDAAGATANARALQDLAQRWTAPADDRPWSALFGAGEVDVDGTVVVGRFPLVDPGKPELVRNLRATRALPPPVTGASAAEGTTSTR